jgi:hypothetical protein
VKGYLFIAKLPVYGFYNVPVHQADQKGLKSSRRPIWIQVDSLRSRGWWWARGPEIQGPGGDLASSPVALTT